MATFNGNDGVVKVGSNAVAEVTSWTITESAAIVGDNSMGDEWDTHLPGRKSWTAAIQCNWDDTDSTGQEALTIGTSVTLNLYPEGDTAGDNEKSGTATVTSIESGGDKENSVVSRSFTCTGNGALTHGTAS